jgi:hypothetical protein
VSKGGLPAMAEAGVGRAATVTSLTGAGAVELDVKVRVLIYH